MSSRRSSGDERSCTATVGPRGGPPPPPPSPPPPMPPPEADADVMATMRSNTSPMTCPRARRWPNLAMCASVCSSPVTRNVRAASCAGGTAAAAAAVPPTSTDASPNRPTPCSSLPLPPPCSSESAPMPPPSSAKGAADRRALVATPAEDGARDGRSTHTANVSTVALANACSRGPSMSGRVSRRARHTAAASRTGPGSARYVEHTDTSVGTNPPPPPPPPGPSPPPPRSPPAATLAGCSPEKLSAVDRSNGSSTSTESHSSSP